ncbi:translocon-associated protein subunit delta-like [Mya arenaria]|uniref:translocon-associated protein subunit delta-like n=1 Tax=Mya arenaria TaxID=6604 RepID=UPI0022E8E7FD|nr:translocon-associated protein subunit delta-like [Mya arenaria]XP_052780859.1 translocon-associated protein subunit delta-like [Mya arenaria]
MIVAGKTIFAFMLVIAPFMVLADVCTSPSVKSSTYTTSEASSSTNTVFIVQFSLSCKNGAKDLTLYADINGKTVPVTRSAENEKYPYQVSFSDENKNLPSGSYDVKFYDEDGFSNLRKAQRSSEGTSSVKSIFSINVSHSGVWKGPLVPSELVATATAVLVWFLAYSARNSLQSS